VFKKRLLIAAPFVWAAIVFILHVIPIKPDREPSFRIPHADKVVHFIMFCTLSFLAYRAVLTHYSNRPVFRKIVVIILICISYGALMEFLQGNYFNERDSDFFDWFADTIGTFCGLWLASTQFLMPLFRFQLRK
jgi:VanZ family protein